MSMSQNDDQSRSASASASMGDSEEMSDHFLCPITQDVMRDPVIASDGVTYERSAIESYFLLGQLPAASPVTRQSITRALIPNYALKALIEEMARARTRTHTRTGAIALGMGMDDDQKSKQSQHHHHHHQQQQHQGLGADEHDGAEKEAAAESEEAKGRPAGVPPPIEIVTRRVAGSDDVVVSLRVAEAEAEAERVLPTLFIDVLDISGSMCNSCVDAATHKSSEASQFSRADLVRHAVRTQVELLHERDQLALVLFDDRANTVLPPTHMDRRGRDAAKARLSEISPRNGTNIWRGLQHALELAASAPAGTNTVIVLQTDGESDKDFEPPRGIPAAFRAWLDAHPDVRSRLSVHTVGYGFGRALDMPLLREIAAAGGGSVNYIPDGSMVGTVLIHLMANLMSCLYRAVTLCLPDLGPGEVHHVGYLQGGQTRDLLIRHVAQHAPFTVVVKAVSAGGVSHEFEAAVESGELPQPTAPAFVTARHALLESLQRALSETEAAQSQSQSQSQSPAPSKGKKAKAEAEANANAAVGMAAVEALRCELSELCGRARAEGDAEGERRIGALLTDLRDAHPNRGQIGKAFRSAEAFERWGRHYVPCVLSGHAAQWPINFKDGGSQIYGGRRTRALIERGDEIFNSLPPPKASAGSGPLLSSMRGIHSAAGPCFLPQSRARMADGSLRALDQLRPGDEVMCPSSSDREGDSVATQAYTAGADTDTDTHTDVHTDTDACARVCRPHTLTARITCVVRTRVSHADVVRLGSGEGGFTLWHPVCLAGRWSFPAAVGRVERVFPGHIYNFLLDGHHSMLIDGVVTCTLGHGFRGSSVVDHSYFGARREGRRHVTDDLSRAEGWARGVVELREVELTRDDCGLVCGMTFAGAGGDRHR